MLFSFMWFIAATPPLVFSFPFLVAFLAFWWTSMDSLRRTMGDLRSRKFLFLAFFFEVSLIVFSHFFGKVTSLEIRDPGSMPIIPEGLTAIETFSYGSWASANFIYFFDTIYTTGKYKKAG